MAAAGARLWTFSQSGFATTETNAHFGGFPLYVDKHVFLRGEEIHIVLFGSECARIYTLSIRVYRRWTATPSASCSASRTFLMTSPAPHPHVEMGRPGLAAAVKYRETRRQNIQSYVVGRIPPLNINISHDYICQCCHLCLLQSVHRPLTLITVRQQM